MKGKAAVFTEIGKPLEIREYPLPEVEPDAMLVQVTLANICGSDLHFLKGHGPGVKGGIPQILGHEMVGKVYKLGKNFTTDSLGRPLQEGDRIAYAYFVPCGTCWACLSGTAACPNRYRYWLGVSCEEPPYFRGAFAQYYYLRSGQWVFKIPDELPDDVVSPINCALSEVIYGLHKIGIVLGDTVVIQGAGGLGLYATAVAREMGAGQVIVMDKLPARLELAKAFGADLTINVAEVGAEERRQMVLERTEGRGADVVAEFVGSPQVVEEGIEMLRYGGRYLLIGNINLGLKGEIDPAQLVRATRTVMGIIVYEPWVIARALQFLQRTQHKYPFSRIISHKFPLEEINEALEFARQGKSIRTSLLPHSS
ncbi:MAG: zinc-binding alcohol dehydrogenase [Nitrospinota bacterium]|nr:MAG: zinc-binding alcohol dehydrogenase [Nitrospinota bacterium]